VFLELSLEARPLRGRIELPAGNLVDVVHDIIGGTRAEVARALKDLMAPQHAMIAEETIDGRRFLLVPSWADWNAVDSSADRVRKHRSQKRSNEPVTRYTALPALPAVTDVTPLEESRVDPPPNGGGSACAREAPPPPPSKPVISADGGRVLEALLRHPTTKPVAQPEFAEAVWGLAVMAGVSVALVEQAIADVAADKAGAGLTDEALRRAVRGYATNARRGKRNTWPEPERPRPVRDFSYEFRDRLRAPPNPPGSRGGATVGQNDSEMAKLASNGPSRGGVT
jgi:hypothetical protein